MACASNHRAVDLARDDSVLDREPVRAPEVDAERRGELVEDLVEPARDDAGEASKTNRTKGAHINTYCW